MAWEIVIAVSVIGIVFLLFLRRPLSSWMDRLRQVSGAGISADTIPQKADPERGPEAVVEKLMVDQDSSLLRETEQIIRKAVQQKNLKGAEAAPVLIRYLASASLALGYEEVYRMIWGSQLDFLRDLVRRPEGCPKAAVQDFYAPAASQYPEIYGQYPLEDWLSYLQAERLVRVDGEHVRITMRGREFLAYLNRMGRSYKKPG